MKIDSFDRAFLDAEGENPQERMARLYGKSLAYTGAEKYIRGIRIHVQNKLEAQDAPEINSMNEVVFKEDGTRTTTRMLLLSDEDSQNPSRIMSLMGLDPVQWELISCEVKRNYWDVTIKNATLGGVKHTNHAYKCTVKVRPLNSVLTSEIVKDVFVDLEPPVLEEYKYKAGGMLLELPIMDLHLGKLAWGEETGEDYDLKIADELYRSTVTEILGKLNAYGVKIERIVYPIGQDYFHVDTVHNTTTAGTALEMDTRWQKMYKAGVDLIVWTIEQLRAIAPVEVVYVPGNHDRMLSYCATVTADAYYNGTKSVTVDLSPKPRKYIHYGVNLIGMSHGEDEKKRIEHLMQTEQPKAWGETIFREWHLGHLHSESAKEIGGVIIRRVSAITATDAWHSEKGFVSAVRKAQAFVWDKEKGKQLTIDSNVMVMENES